MKGLCIYLIRRRSLFIHFHEKKKKDAADSLRDGLEEEEKELERKDVNKLNGERERDTRSRTSRLIEMYGEETAKKQGLQKRKRKKEDRVNLEEEKKIDEVEEEGGVRKSSKRERNREEEEMVDGKRWNRMTH